MTPKDIDRAAVTLAGGGVVAFPTDTVYGVGAAVASPAAVRRLFGVKGLAHTQAIAVLVDSVEQATRLGLLDQRAVALAGSWWPGALTLVIPRQPSFDVDLGGEAATIGLRCPDDDGVRALCRRVGPIAATSANRSGEPTLASGAEIRSTLGGRVDLVIDGGVRSTIASTVVSLLGPDLEVLRRGDVSEEQLRATLPPLA